MNPTTSLDNKAARAHPATISKDKEDADREILQTYFFEWIDGGIGTDETPLYTLGQGRETLSDAEARALGRAQGLSIPFWITLNSRSTSVARKKGREIDPVIYYKILEKRDEAEISLCARTAG